MKEYQLTNTTQGFIHLLDTRKIEYYISEGGKEKGKISIWLPSDEHLFLLAQDYEQQKDELNKLFPTKGISQQLKEIWEDK